MGLIQSIIERVKGTKSGYEFLFDLDIIESDIQSVYLQKMAIDSVLSFVARTFSTAKFSFKNGKDVVESDWDYILNVRPNKNESASDFWQRAIYKLMFDNELLIVLSDDNQLLIADDFYQEEYAIYESRFTDVTVKEYTFRRTFYNSDVIYIRYGNEKLQSVLDGLFKDYGKLFGRMLQIALRNNQIRGSLKTGQTSTFDEKTRVALQNYVERMYDSFNNESVAVVPLTKDFDYEEYTNKTGVQNQSADELNKVKKAPIDDVARIVGIPSALIHGEMANSEANSKAYRTQTVTPLVKKITDELNAKLLSKKDYTNGLKVQITGVHTPDIFELATAIDKLVSSMAFSPNDVREELGRERVDDAKMDKYYLTKNYSEQEGTTKGGEAE